MPDIDVNKLYHMEDAYGSSSWNSWSIGCGSLSSDDAKKNNIVKGLLFQSIPEDLVLQIGNLKTEKEMWEAIKTRNLGADRVKEARLQAIIAEFENLKMLDNDTIDEYVAKLSGIASKSATLGEVMSEHNLVKKFLTSLPRHFVHIVAALEQVLDLKTMGFEDVVRRLIAYEETVKEEDKSNDPQENSLYARTEYSNGNNDSRGERGRGSYSRGRRQGRGQGHGRGNSQNQGQRDSMKNHEENEQKGTNEVGRESHEKVNPHSSSVTVHEINTESEEDNSRSDGMLIRIARLENMRLLISLAAGKGWKTHHLDAVYRKVPNEEFIIVAVIEDDLFVTGTSLVLINEFKNRMASQSEMSDLGELTYYLGIEVSQGKHCIEIKQERYVIKILIEARMEDCNPFLCPMEPGLKLSKADPEVEATQYRKW
nr:hypothetical protein [Tanacetum cinerariifolium]